MSEPLTITSETRLSFEIEHGPKTYMLIAKNGTWELSHYESQFWRNIGSVKRLSWIGALTRALTEVGAYDRERDGVTG